MSIEKRWRLICYDIRDDKRYRQVFKIIKAAGYSVQYSVFRARLDDREVEELRWELSRAMAPEDALLIVDLCPSCARNVVSRNHVDGWTEEPPDFTIVGNDQLRGPAKTRAQRRRGLARTRPAASDTEASSTEESTPSRNRRS